MILSKEDKSKTNRVTIVENFCRGVLRQHGVPARRN
jgi:hypothetical protein